jgi:PAS domain S-box-containing protein
MSKNLKLTTAINELCKAISTKILCDAVLVFTLNNSNQYFYSEKNLDSAPFKNDDFIKAIIGSNLKDELLIEKKGLSKSLKWLNQFPSINSLEIFPIEIDKDKDEGFVVVFNANQDKSVKTIDLLTFELFKLKTIFSEDFRINIFSYYENIFNISSEMICVVGMDGNFKRINPTFRRTILRSENEILDHKISDFIHKDDLNELSKKSKEITKKTKSIDISLRFKVKDGSYRKIEWVLSVDFQNSLLYGIGRDVTKLEETKHELLRAKEMLEDTNREAKIGGWEFDVFNKDLYWTSITKEIHEVPSDFDINVNNAMTFYKEGLNKEAILKSFEIAVLKEIPYDLELELVTAKGNHKWVRVIGNPQFEGRTCIKVTGTIQDITKSKQNRTALEDMNTHIQAILNASTETSIISTDLTGRITHFNTGSELLLGYSAKELIGIYTPIIFYKKEELEKQSNDIYKEYGVNVEPGINSFRYKSKLGEPDNSEFTYIRRHGGEIDVKVSVTPIRDRKENIIGYLSIAIDITEKKLWEKKILESEKRYRIFFDSSQMVMYTHDMEGNFQSINEIGAELLGYNKKDINRKNIANMIPFKSKLSFAHYLKELNEKGKSKGLFQIVNNSGREVTWMFNNVVAESANGKNYVLGNVMDITDRIELERDLNEAKKTAELNAKMKDLFLANMSHEIRTPMNAITGFGKLLSETNLNEEQSDYLKSVNAASNSLLSIINDILDFSKIESGHIIIESIEFNIKDQVKNLESLVRKNAEDKELDFSINLDDNFPEHVVGDPTRLSQILTNLTCNAIKFTESGYVKLNGKLLSEEDDFFELEFNITDSGIGISKDKIDVIFERFTQANTNTTRKYGGTGLGLNISKSLVELQDGTFHVDSEENKGSTFGFRIRFKKVSTSFIPIIPANIKRSFESVELKILLVEDNLLNQKLTLKVLANQGFKTKLAENGKVAVSYLKQEVFDLVLMDLQMPEMDGYQATNYIRKILRLEIPIIAMTAHSLVGEKEKCIKIGMNDYLTKPFNQDHLYEKIMENTTKNPVTKAKKSYDLEYLKSMAEGNKDFEKDIISTSLLHIPENLMELLTAIRLLDLNSISQTAHKLKSSFFIMGIDEEGLLQAFEHDGIGDLSTLERMYCRLDEIFKSTSKSLELELEENYS